MKRCQSLGRVVAVLALSLIPTDARAHFLFARIGSAAEGGRRVEVFFSERAESGDPKFVDKIAGTELWLQTEPGVFRSLEIHKGSDRLSAQVPASGSVVVVGRCDYGVLARPNQIPFLLRHYPKAMAGKPEELAKRKPFEKLPLEVVAKVEGDQIHLSLLRDGQPVPEAEFETVDADLNNQTLTANLDGVATWTPPSSGEYSVYAQNTIAARGEFHGKPYEEIREFATLAFTWPLTRSGADPEAVALFEKALDARANWNDFPGFKAEIRGTADGRVFEGEVAVKDDGTMEISLDEPTARAWVKDQLGSIVMHRLAEGQGGAEPVLRFADEVTDHPLGRLLVFEGGRFASSYRVKDGRISVVDRNIGRHDMTIQVLEESRTAEGKYLPKAYTVQYWNAENGDLERVETVQEDWTRVGPIDLPTYHAVSTVSNAGFSFREFRLSKHALMSAP